MPNMDGTGPDREGKLTGRGLGKCREVSDEEALARLGKGMGLRRKSGGGHGRGERLKSSRGEDYDPQWRPGKESGCCREESGK